MLGLVKIARPARFYLYYFFLSTATRSKPDIAPAFEKHLAPFKKSSQ